MQEYGVKAVLLNPLSGYIALPDEFKGEHTHPFLKEKYLLDDSYIAQAEKLNCEELAHPENFMVLLQENDELLDYRQALEKYKKSTIICEKGGDHSFQGFERHIAASLSFLFDIS